MTILRWCVDCREDTAHHTEDSGVVFVNGVRHHMPEDYCEMWCSKCRRFDVWYYGDELDAVLHPLYTQRTSAEATSAKD